MGGGQHAQSLAFITVCSGSSSFVSLFFFSLTLQCHFFFFMSDTTTEQFLIPEE